MWGGTKMYPLWLEYKTSVNEMVFVSALEGDNSSCSKSYNVWFFISS